MIVYVDGFNLYYGAVRGTPYKWLDIAAVCERLFPRDEIVRIRYFTARIKGREGDAGAPQRQETYLRALRTIRACRFMRATFGRTSGEGD